MSRVGRAKQAPSPAAEAGFTLLEMLAVLVIVALVAALVGLSARSSGSAGLKAAAAQAAARFRDARVAAVRNRGERTVLVDAHRRLIDDRSGRPALALEKDIHMMLTAAQIERRAAGIGGVRFFPNGSSTGGTLTLQRNSQAYEIRINWLSGRVSVARMF